MDFYVKTAFAVVLSDVKVVASFYKVLYQHIKRDVVGCMFQNLSGMFLPKIAKSVTPDKDVTKRVTFYGTLCNRWQRRIDNGLRDKLNSQRIAD